MTDLDPKIFDKEPPQRSMREGFGEGLVLAAAADKRVVGLCADLTESTHMLAFKEKFPDRFVQVGVAEQNLVTVASGMAAMGKVPFAASYAIFSPGRNWEQIRTTICYNDRPVKIVGSHAGVTVGADGGSHQALEDIALMRVLPRMTVLSPCDAREARKAAQAAAKTDGPVYIRLSRDSVPIITAEDAKFEIGKARMIFGSEGKADVALIATGPSVYEALMAAKELESEGRKAKVMNLSTIKPLDTDAIVRLAHETGAVVTVEDHQAAGGMGSAVAECLAANYPVPIEFVAVKDAFGQSGRPDELIELYKLDKGNILDAVRRAMVRKK